MPHTSSSSSWILSSKNYFVQPKLFVAPYSFNESSFDCKPWNSSSVFLFFLFFFLILLIKRVPSLCSARGKHLIEARNYPGIFCNDFFLSFRLSCSLGLSDCVFRMRSYLPTCIWLARSGAILASNVEFPYLFFFFCITEDKLKWWKDV